MALTNGKVFTAKATQGKPRFIADDGPGGVRGLILIVNPKGKKSFAIRVDLWEGKRRVKSVRRVIGPVRPGFGVEEAREKARAVLKELHTITDDTDPFGWTWADALKFYIELPKGARHREDIEDRMRLHLGSLLPLKLRETRKRDLFAVAERLIAAEKFKTAWKALADLSTAYNHALARSETLPANPVPAVAKHLKAQHKRQVPRTERATIEPEDLPLWFANLRKLPNATRRAMFALGLYSGLRPGLLMSLRVAWVRDLDGPGARIVVPRAEMKIKHDRPDFECPLTPRMVALVRDALAARAFVAPASPFLFPSTTSASGHQEKPTEKNLVTGHALRRAHKKAGAHAGVPYDEVEHLQDRALNDEGEKYLGRRDLRGAQEKISEYFNRLDETRGSS